MEKKKREYFWNSIHEKLSSYMDDETNTVGVIKKLLPLPPNAHLQHCRSQKSHAFSKQREREIVILPEQLRWKRFWSKWKSSLAFL